MKRSGHMSHLIELEMSRTFSSAGQACAADRDALDASRRCRSSSESATPGPSSLGRFSRRSLSPSLALIAALALTALGCPSSEIHRARDLESQGRIREAAVLYLEVAKADPANLAAWDGAVKTWCQKEANVGECLAVLDLELGTLGSIDRHKDALAEVLEARARARIAQGLIDAALSDLDRAEHAAPARASVHVARAKALMMRGDREGASASLARARQIEPGHPEADVVEKDMLADEPGIDEPKLHEGAKGQTLEGQPLDGQPSDGRTAKPQASGDSRAEGGAPSRVQADGSTPNHEAPSPKEDDAPFGGEPVTR